MLWMHLIYILDVGGTWVLFYCMTLVVREPFSTLQYTNLTAIFVRLSHQSPTVTSNPTHDSNEVQSIRSQIGSNMSMSFAALTTERRKKRRPKNLHFIRKHHY